MLAIGLIAAFLLTAIFGWFLFDVVPGLTTRFDASVRGSIHEAARPILTTVMIAASTIGKPAVLWIFALMIAAVFWRSGRKPAAETIVITLVGAFILEGLLKLLFHRKRPEAYFGYTLPSTYSFPSGHAIFSVCFFGVLALVLSPLLRSASARVLLWFTALASAAIIGVSRVYLGVHYPTDVISGYLTASVWVFAVAESNRPRRSRVKPE